MKIFLGRGQERAIVDATIVRENPKTVVVRLADGNVIKRKKNRDIPSAQEVEAWESRGV